MKRMFVTALGGSLAVALLGLVFVGSAVAQSGGGSGRDWTGCPAVTGADTGPVASIEEVRERAARFLDEVGLSSLTVGEVIPFANHFYAAVLAPETGDGALELLISRDGQRVHPEPGPTMMWNTEYSPMIGADGAALHRALEASMMDGGPMGMVGMMGTTDTVDAMMGWGQSGMMGDVPAAGFDRGRDMPGMAPTGDALARPLTTEAALTRVQAWLDENRPGLTAADPVTFPGYVTFGLERNGEIAGMASIQTSTGAIWEHTWHGDAITSPAPDDERSS